MQTKPICLASLIENFYANLNYDLRVIIAQVLQESDPQELAGIHRNTIKEEAQAAFPDDYAAKPETN